LRKSQNAFRKEPNEGNHKDRAEPIAVRIVRMASMFLDLCAKIFDKTKKKNDGKASLTSSAHLL
jgi:hypothetical protein